MVLFWLGHLFSVGREFGFGIWEGIFLYKAVAPVRAVAKGNVE